MRGLTEEQRLALTLVPPEGRTEGERVEGAEEFMQKGWEMPNENEDLMVHSHLAVWASLEHGRSYQCGEYESGKPWVELSRSIEGVKGRTSGGCSETLAMAALCALARWRP